MTLHEGLIEQARQLATQEHRRPLQVSLRRGAPRTLFGKEQLDADELGF